MTYVLSLRATGRSVAIDSKGRCEGEARGPDKSGDSSLLVGHPLG